MKQKQIFKDTDEDPIKNIGRRSGLGLGLEVRGGKRGLAIQYNDREEVRRVDLSDTLAKRIFIVELVESGAIKSKLANALSISRQSIDNYIERKEIFGTSGLINSFRASQSTNLADQRKENQHNLPKGNINQKISDIRKKKRIEKEKNKPVQATLPFNIENDEKEKIISTEEQPFTENHNWQETRYAGVFLYLIHLLSTSRLLTLLGGYFGNRYKIFMVFILMITVNIRSLEQLKNVRKREAGIIIGLGRIPSKPKVWEWFYRAAHLNVGQEVLDDYFLHQVRSGQVSCNYLFIDGHLLPYTGKEKVHCGFSTQRGIPLPGQTNMVTCDATGRIVDFDIQEGTGDLRSYISVLAAKWSNEMPESTIYVFDREGYGGDFFYGLQQNGICFSTWDKYVNTEKLSKIPEEDFTEKLEFNGKQYRYFEQSKNFNITTDQGEDKTITLRQFIIWNLSADRRTAILSDTGVNKISAKDCIVGILNRWGASENTFKHIKDRHPYHYHPGFKCVKSDNQEVANPILKELKSAVQKLTNKIKTLKVRLADKTPFFNKDGSARKNSAYANLKEIIANKKSSLDQAREDAKKEPERVKTSSIEDYEQFERIDNEGKKLFDLVTSCVWNARKEMVDWLRPHWKTDNEIVDLFYAITKCHGWIHSSRNEVRVRLEPLEQRSRRFAQEQLCRKLSYLAVRLPNGKRMVIEVGDSPL